MSLALWINNMFLGALAPLVILASPKIETVESPMCEAPRERKCVVDLGDYSAALFYVIDFPEKLVRNMAKVVPGSLATALNYQVYGDLGPPVDMKSGDVTMQYEPTAEISLAKFARDNEALASMMRQLPDGNFIEVRYSSDVLADGSVTFTMRSVRRNSKGEEAGPYEPTVAIHLEPTDALLPIEGIPDRKSRVMKAESFIVGK